MKKIVVAGIGTGIGKTFIATILTEAMKADYWKPVQAGNLDDTDTDFVKRYITNEQSFLHPEKYRLAAAMSPHAAAKLEAVEIDLLELQVPETGHTLIIEVAGGLMVPLNEKQLNIDLIKQWDVPVILVSKNYLGSINHTLLSVSVLKSYGVSLLGIIFNGERNTASESFILNYTGVNCIGRINQEQEINKKIVRQYADVLKVKLQELIQ